MSDSDVSDSEAEPTAQATANETTPLIASGTRTRTRRGRRHRRREAQAEGTANNGVTTSGQEGAASPEEPLASTSGHFSVNCDVLERGELVSSPETAMTSSTTTVVVVEPDPTSSRPSRGSSRSFRRTDAIV